MTFGPAWMLTSFAWLSALTVAAFYDLGISRAWASRYDPLGRWISRFGEWPAWVVVLICLVILFPGRRSAPAWIRARRMAKKTVILALIHPLVITQSLKLLWGRVRFARLAMDLSDYTPFYTPAGLGAGKSFPSGHVAMASVTCMIPIYLQRHGHTRLAWLAWALVAPYITMVAWGRILAGAHYLSDCLFSAGLALLLAKLLVEHDFQKDKALAHQDNQADT